MKYKITTIEWDDTVEADSCDDALIKFATAMDLDMSRYFKAVPLDPERKCSNCKNRAWNSWCGIEQCLSYELAETEEEEIESAAECSKYENGTPECFEEEHYCPSATAGDYSPSNPWDAPGMSKSMFI